MLSKDALTQLSQLKNEIQASKEYGTGEVASTSGRFGFVRLDDGRDAFLSPEKMQRVLAGDIVRVSITQNEKQQWEADLEELISSPLDRFVGQYRVKGAGHFVVPIGNQAHRWIFVPPKLRAGCKEGDFVAAKMTRHPYKDGKSQAKVLERIGQPDDPKIEHHYIAAKYDLNRRLSHNAEKQVKAIHEQISAQAFNGRRDLTDLPFVTIDAESTRDMDDAITLIHNDDGSETLLVAIADPSSFIEGGSPLAYHAQKNGQSVYLLGGTLPMLPETLANDIFSLSENQVRPALICAMTLGEDGAVKDYSFERGLIRSCKKLSYNTVGTFLEGGELELGEEPTAQQNRDTLISLVKALFAWSEKRQEYRRTHCLVSTDQSDFEYRLDDTGKITDITPRPKTLAHQIVEECMLATNACAGEFLAQHAQGLHMRHNGFREDRLGEVKALLKEENIDYQQPIDELPGHLALLKSLADNAEKQSLLPALRRFMRSSEMSLEPGPHLGLGFRHYATITSPIRRFADFYNHWAINAILSETTVKKPLEEPVLETLKTALQNGRQADRELQQWLICQFAESLKKQTLKGKIRIVTQQGFGVRLLDTGIEGFVLFPKNAEKKFDAKRMTLTVDDVTYGLEQEVGLTIKKIDMDKRRIGMALKQKDDN